MTKLEKLALRTIHKVMTSPRLASTDKHGNLVCSPEAGKMLSELSSALWAQNNIDTETEWDEGHSPGNEFREKIEVMDTREPLELNHVPFHDWADND
jgi:hypothetical protein